MIINIHILSIYKMGTLWEHSNRVFRGAEQGFESLPLRTLITRFLLDKLLIITFLNLTYSTRIYVIRGHKGTFRGHSDPPLFDLNIFIF